VLGGDESVCLRAFPGSPAFKHLRSRPGSGPAPAVPGLPPPARPRPASIVRQEFVQVGPLPPSRWWVEKPQHPPPPPCLSKKKQPVSLHFPRRQPARVFPPAVSRFDHLNEPRVRSKKIAPGLKQRPGSPFDRPLDQRNVPSTYFPRCFDRRTGPKHSRCLEDSTPQRRTHVVAPPAHKGGARRSRFWPVPCPQVRRGRFIFGETRGFAAVTDKSP